eukprot:TRINITY_DN6476_c0_g1_i3.p1 TRINITY_DN6476_c0_g1~~TRINITY_DN6476_c0_g1_i3.p1  ORF type:complete len:190 (+),score=45.03 TRINITY_DN6476_c0_g1_i3:150-719(+)
MNKEIAIRRRIGNIYNKREEDFPSLKDYNDYLESVEDLIFNLTEGVNVQALEAQILRYQEENAEQIVASKARKAEELAAALRANEGPVNTEVVQAELQNSQQAQQASQGVATHYTPAVPMGGLFMQPRPAGPGSQPIPLGQGPLGGDGLQEDEEAQKIRREKAARAGGWTPDMAQRRAFEEAFSSLWVN